MTHFYINHLLFVLVTSPCVNILSLLEFLPLSRGIVIYLTQKNHHNIINRYKRAAFTHFYSLKSAKYLLTDQTSRLDKINYLSFLSPGYYPLKQANFICKLYFVCCSLLECISLFNLFNFSRKNIIKPSGIEQFVLFSFIFLYN